MISKTEKIFCGLTRQDKKKNVLEGLSHVTCDVNVRTKHDDNDQISGPSSVEIAPSLNSGDRHPPYL